MPGHAALPPPAAVYSCAFPSGMSSVKIECVGSDRYRLGESPVWDEKENSLLCVDITGRKVCRWDAASGQVQAVSVGKELLWCLVMLSSWLCSIV